MAIPSYKNRVGMSTTGTPGTGTITLNAAETGYQSFASAYGANANVDILIEEGSAWEIARDCTYTHSGTTVTRGTLEASSTGSALSLTSAAKVYVINSAARIQDSAYLIRSGFSARADGTNQASVGAGSTTLVSDYCNTVDFNFDGAFSESTGIWQPTKAGLYLIGGTAIASSSTGLDDGITIAVYVEHSTDGSTWTGAAKRAILWRGNSGSSDTANRLGGSGAYLVYANGSTDRFRLTIYYSGTDTSVKVPGTAANSDWLRFWARYIGETA